MAQISQRIIQVAPTFCMNRNQSMTTSPDRGALDSSSATTRSAAALQSPHTLSVVISLSLASARSAAVWSHVLSRKTGTRQLEHVLDLCGQAGSTGSSAAKFRLVTGRNLDFIVQKYIDFVMQMYILSIR